MKRILPFILLLPLMACTKTQKGESFFSFYVGHTFGNVTVYKQDCCWFMPVEHITESIQVLSPTEVKITMRHYWKKPETEQRLSAVYTAFLPRESSESCQRRPIIKLKRKRGEPKAVWFYENCFGKPVEPTYVYIYSMSENIIGLDFYYGKAKRILKLCNTAEEKNIKASTSYAKEEKPKQIAKDRKRYEDEEKLKEQLLYSGEFCPRAEILKKDFVYNYPEPKKGGFREMLWPEEISKAASLPVHYLANKALVIFSPENSAKFANLIGTRLGNDGHTPDWVFDENGQLSPKSALYREHQFCHIEYNKLLYIANPLETDAAFYRIDNNMYIAAGYGGERYSGIAYLVDSPFKGLSDTSKEVEKVPEQ